MAASNESEKAYLSSEKAKAYLAKKKRSRIKLTLPQIGEAAPKVVSIPESEFADFCPLPYETMATIWEVSTPEEELDIIHAAMIYTYSGTKPKGLPSRVEAILNMLIKGCLKTSRTKAKAAKNKHWIEDANKIALGDDTIDDAENVDIETGEMQEAQEPPKTASAPPPPLPRSPAPPKVSVTNDEREKYFDGSVFRYKDTHEIATESDLPF